ncbi:MAG: AAA family ATPase [Bacteroidaceae bacterium]|nr:AAA family ATPase [Bacteroidaceae bacterium]
MKIEKITIRNLTSIEGEQTIDFTQEPLRSAGLFAITGDTGSGKSTVLDAVCVALYGRAPRFEGIEGIRSDKLAAGPDGDKSIQAKDPRGLLRRGEKEGGSSVVFSLPDGRSFEATWSVRLKRTGTYERATQTFRQLTPHVKEYPAEEVKGRILDTVGLDYDQFTRTVMLAQNSFASFLRARHDEKSALLEKLTGTEIYGKLSVKIYDKAREAEAVVKDYATQSDTLMLSHLSPEQLAETAEEQQGLQTQIDAVTAHREAVARQIEWLDNYQRQQREVERLERAREEADRARVMREADEHALRLFDRAQPIAPLWTRIQDLRAAERRWQEQEEQMGRDLINATQRQNEAEKQLARARDNRQESERTLADRQDDIQRGFRLIGEIDAARQATQRAEKVAEEAERDFAGKHDTAERQKARLAEQEQAVAKDKFHWQTLNVHSAMFENFGIVKDRLTEFHSEAAINEASHRKLADMQMRLSELAQTVDRLEQQGRDSQTRMLALQNRLDIHRQGVRGIDGPLLQQKASETTTRLGQLSRAEKLWRRIAQGYELVSERQSKYSRDDVDIEQLRHKIEIAHAEEAKLRDENDRHYKSYTLSQSQDIQSLRGSLVEGRPCPLCGATHHPYHTETERALGELVSNLRYEWQDSNARLARHRESLRALELELSRLETVHLADMDYLDDRRRMLQEDIEEWKTYAALDGSFADSSATVNHHARITHISLLIDRTKREGDELQRALREYTHHQHNINQISEEIAQLNAQMQDDKERAANARIDVATTEGTISNLRENADLSDKRYRDLYQDLDGFISITSWLDEWKKGADDFRTRLSGMEADWRRINNAIEIGESRLAQSRTELQQMQAAETEAKRMAVEAADELRSLREALGEKEGEFARIFGESDPATLQLQLQNAIAEARENEERADKAWRAASDTVTELSGRRQKLVEQREADAEDYQRCTSELDRWILSYNREHAPIQNAELDKLLGSGRDYLLLRRELRDLRDAQKAAVQSLAAAEKALQEMTTLPTKPRVEGEAGREMLLAEADTITLKLSELKQQHIAVSSRLIAHEEAERRLGLLAADMERAREDYAWWSRLSKVYGSADGKRFRELAQQYTFASLVARANTQLARFSPRYRLAALPGTLTLEVIDRDMFDRRRYANSLSGGETFVVSLALALALSSLSGAGLPLGSLFIDEGFGNLDRDSLNLVMDALSNLESIGGRKVGIISHTEQIRTGITPQIHLVRAQGTAGSAIRIE